MSVNLDDIRNHQYKDNESVSQSLIIWYIYDFHSGQTEKMEAQAPVNQTPPKNGPQMNQKKNLKVSNAITFRLYLS